MKVINKKLVSMLCILVVVLSIGIFLICQKDTDKITLDEVKLKEPEKESGMFAIMLQSSKGSEEYTQSEGETFPKDGYILNEEKSGCLDSNGKKLENVTLSFNEETGKVKVDVENTSYCYIYFDIKEPHSYADLYEDDDTKLSTGDGYLIYHDGEGTYANLEAGDNSYRFAGNNPDNYVCLDGDNNATGTCTDIKKLYRVIGWFPKEGNTSEYQMKLIKSEYITADELGGDLASSKVSKASESDFTPRANVKDAVGFLWSGISSITWNNWKSSKLNETLNSESGIYLQSLSAYIDLIEDTKWYIGGNESNNIVQQTNMKATYENELGANKLKEGSQSCVNDSKTTVPCTEALLYEENKKIGLMYATEYGYASAPSNWSSQLYSYNNTNNRSANWLYNGVFERTLSRQSDSASHAFYVGSGGFVDGYNLVDYNRYGVRPVLVLKSNATVKSGDGSKLSPWRINLQSS